MDADKIISYDEFLTQIYSKSFDDILKITGDSVQEYVVKIMMTSFTDPNHIQMFIDKFSPNEEIKEIRNTLWVLLR